MYARIAAVNFFQIDLDKSWNYLWYCYARAPVPPLPPLSKVKGGSAPVMHPHSGVPALSSHEQLPVKSWRIVRTILHSKASASLAFQSHRKVLNHKELSLGCSVTVINGAKIYIRFVVYGSQVIKKCYSSLFVNFNSCKALIKCKSLW